MKVLGKFMGGHNPRNFAVGSFAAFDVAWVNVETYTGAPVEKDKRCLLNLGTAYLIAQVKAINGDYINPEVANSLVKNMATKDILDLDEYDMGFWDVWDIRPDSICIRNEVDEDYNTIPLEVAVIGV